MQSCLDKIQLFGIVERNVLVKAEPTTHSPFFSIVVEIQLMCNQSENAMIYVLNAVNGRTDLNINQFTSENRTRATKKMNVQIVRFVNLALYTQSNTKR